MKQLEIAGFRLSLHAEAVIKERELDLKWIEATVSDPEITMLGEDGNMHYVKTIPEINKFKS